MLEVHQLRQSLNTVRQELSHALYQVRLAGTAAVGRRPGTSNSEFNCWQQMQGCVPVDGNLQPLTNKRLLASSGAALLPPPHTCLPGSPCLPAARRRVPRDCAPHARAGRLPAAAGGGAAGGACGGRGKARRRGDGCG